MESNEVLIDFSLPNNPDTLKFLKLKQSDKIKAIAWKSSIAKLG